MSAAAPQAVRNQQAQAQEKAKKQKKLLAVLSVVFLALVGYQLPKLLGGDSQPSSASGGTPPAATGVAPTPAAPGTPAPAPAGLPTSLPDTDRVVVQPQSGQLLSFGLFKSKDPFVQQLGGAETVPTSETTATTETTATEPTLTGSQPSQPHSPPRLTTQPVVPSSPVPSQVTLPSRTTPTPTTPTPTTSSPAPPPAQTTTTPTAPTSAPGTVSISTNGVCEEVALKATFPKGRNLFRVTSIAKDGKSAKIAIVGGAYDTGTPAATIQRGENLTLVNTADGTRYVLKLLSSCDVETTAAPRTEAEPTTTTTRTTTTPTTSTPTTTTPTTTEPIVEDELDNGEAEEQAGQ
jgi:hypothetical protein